MTALISWQPHEIYCAEFGNLFNLDSREKMKRWGWGDGVED